jgi:hypothetical protein
MIVLMIERLRFKTPDIDGNGRFFLRKKRLGAADPVMR